MIIIRHFKGYTRGAVIRNILEDNNALSCLFSFLCADGPGENNDIRITAINLSGYAIRKLNFAVLGPSKLIGDRNFGTYAFVLLSNYGVADTNIAGFISRKLLALIAIGPIAVAAGRIRDVGISVEGGIDFLRFRRFFFGGVTLFSKRKTASAGSAIWRTQSTGIWRARKRSRWKPISR